MPPPTAEIHKDKYDVTRDRILDEAEELFAHKGFHAVSVREITKAASCNLAAVNYHFGNKQNLYLEVFRQRWLPRAGSVHRYFKDVLKSNGNLSADTLVQALAKAFLDGPLSDEERKRHHLLISGELAQPTDAFEMVVGQALRPLFESLQKDLRSVMPADIKEEQLSLHIFSIFAMVLYFNFARPLISNITGYDDTDDFKNRLIDHIVRFSLNGLGACQREEGK